MTTSGQNNTGSCKDDEADRLPGFRFHPTDEELVGFYLRRKVDKKPLSIELIKQIDIYKYDPWDLPKISSTPDKEGYFFCKRGRKYRNSIRPNRVTGSGFWKATGIDKPVCALEGASRDCIGLKKTLVYYRGSAGKGTKTDWMMHEFRLPSNDNSTANNFTDAKINLPEAEVWTICRIFKRIMSYRKYTPEWREQSSTKRQSVTELPSSNFTCSLESNYNREAYISFEAPAVHHHSNKMKSSVDQLNERNHFVAEQLSSTVTNNNTESMASSSVCPNAYGNDHDELLTYENWDELRSVVEFAFDPSPL